MWEQVTPIPLWPWKVKRKGLLGEQLGPGQRENDLGQPEEAASWARSEEAASSAILLLSPPLCTWGLPSGCLVNVAIQPPVGVISLPTSPE